MNEYESTTTIKQRDDDDGRDYFLYKVEVWGSYSIYSFVVHAHLLLLNVHVLLVRKFCVKRTKHTYDVFLFPPQTPKRICQKAITGRYEFYCDIPTTYQRATKSKIDDPR